jgi:hypothetical protein
MRTLIQTLFIVFTHLHFIASVRATETIPGRFSATNSSTTDNSNRTTNVLPESLAPAFNSPYQQISHPTISTESISLTYLNMKHITGGSSIGSTGDTGAASSATIRSEYFWVDPNSGNIYLADGSNYRIRKITASTQIISAFGGTGSPSSSGTGGPIGSVSFSTLLGIVGDTASNFLYFSDSTHIWKYSFSTGIVSVIAGNGNPGFTGDNGPAGAAQLSTPYGLWLTTGGDLYIADFSNHRIRKITSSTGIITTMAGSGGTGTYGGDIGPATSATLNFPTGVYVDTTGKIFIADFSNYRIRVMSTSGIITTFAGTGSATPFTSDGAQATSTNINKPSDMKGDSAGNIYYSDNNKYIIRMIDTSGIVATLFGTGSPGFSSGVVPRLSRIYGPCGIWLDSLSTIYFSDQNSIHRSVDGTPTSQPSRQPTTQPTGQQTQPTRVPSGQPSERPSSQPSPVPSSQPTSKPSRQPSSRPSRQPSSRPTVQPTRCPSFQPTGRPSNQPTSRPSCQPSSRPTNQPTRRPSTQPSSRPSGQPTSRPTRCPSSQPTGRPSNQPTGHPSCRPTSRPSGQPTGTPSSQPTAQPSRQPSSQPVVFPLVYQLVVLPVNRLPILPVNRPGSRVINPLENLLPNQVDNPLLCPQDNHLDNPLPIRPCLSLMST